MLEDYYHRKSYLYISFFKMMNNINGPDYTIESAGQEIPPILSSSQHTGSILVNRLGEIERLTNHMKNLVTIEPDMILIRNSDGSLKANKKGEYIVKSKKEYWYQYWTKWKKVTIQFPWKKVKPMNLFISDEDEDSECFNNICQFSYSPEDIVDLWRNIKKYTNNRWVNIDEKIRYDTAFNRRNSEENVKSTCDAIKIMREMLELEDGNYWLNNSEWSDYLVKYSSFKGSPSWFTRAQAGRQWARIIIDIDKLTSENNIIETQDD